MADKPEVIIIRETWPQSWIRDSSSVVGFVALIYIGVYLESSALQWTGALIGFLVIAGRMARIVKDSRFTVEQARKRLDEIEADQA